MAYFRYYRHTLPQAWKGVYDSFLSCLEGRKAQATAPLVSREALNRILFALNFDNPQLYYVDFAALKFFRQGDRLIFRGAYSLGEEECRKLDRQIEDRVREVLTAVQGQSPQDGALSLHDFLVSRCTDGCPPEAPGAAHSILGPLVYGVSVCEGYAKAFQYLANRIRLRSAVVVGTLQKQDGQRGGHAWNLVKLGKDCYHADVTLDHFLESRACSRAYWLLSDSQIRVRHCPDPQFPLPSCPLSANPLPQAGAREELKALLKAESRAGAPWSQVRLGSSLSQEEIAGLLAGHHPLWPRQPKAYSYCAHSSTLYIRWEK